MDLREAIQRRRSTAAITDEAPTDAELAEYLGLAAHAPDHAGLLPWRLVTVRGSQREVLGAALADGFGDEPGSREATRTASKPLRAPLLIGIVATPVIHPKVPEWEQVAAAVAVVTTLELVMFEAGWTVFWRSGPAVDLPGVNAVMGVSPTERLLGWLYVGRTADSAVEPRGENPDVTGKITSLG